MKQLSIILIFSLCYLSEYISPLRKRVFDSTFFIHLRTNLFLVGCGFLTIKLVTTFVISPQDEFFLRRGLLDYLELGFLKFFFSIILLDFFIWIQHVLTHKINFLWNFHCVHHADRFLDSSSGVRFHPLEILGSYFYKLLLILLLGVEIEHFIFFELLLSGSAIFNHSNINLGKYDYFISWIFVTPKFHQVHHSEIRLEHDSNYGFFLSIWDRGFGTFIAYERIKKNLRIGLTDANDSQANSLFFLLKWPLSRLLKRH